MAEILEELSPLGFTPLISSIKGEILKYNFRGVGPKAWDKSGHGNHGTLKPKDDPPRRKILLLFPPKVGMVFDGENDYIETNIPNWNPKSDFTIKFSFKTSKIPERRFAIMEFGVDSPGRHLYEFGYQRLYWRDKNNELAYIGTGLEPEPGEEYEVVLARKGTTLKGGYNGEYRWTEEDTRSGREFYLGKMTLGAYVTYSYFKGILTRIVIYNRALSEDEL